MPTQEHTVTVTLSVRKTGPRAQPGFQSQVLIDGEAAAPRDELSWPQSRAVGELLDRYEALLGESCEPGEAKRIMTAMGRNLFRLWFARAWTTVTARVQPGSQRILVIASEASEILNLPWELLLPPDHDFLGLDPRFGVRRLPWSDRALAPPPGRLPPRPLRILFMACAPQGLPALGYEQEEQALLEAVSQAGQEVALEFGDLGTFKELQRRINEFRPHVVHLSGHGIVGKDGLGYFAFEDESGHVDLCSSKEIGGLFAGSGVQCAFVSGCETGQAPPAAALGGVCQGLVGAEVPLAVGWAASIRDPHATKFAAAFYDTLASGRSVERALVQARREISQDGGPSWVLPVLYAMSAQGQVFDLDPARPPEPPRQVAVQYPLPGIEGYASHFVGRRREIQRLLPALRNGKWQVVLITGLAGVGKSTLATRLARRLRDFKPIAVPSSKDLPLGAARLLQTCADAFLAQNLEEAHDRLQQGRQSVVSRLHYIVDVLNKHRFVLVLDNFEVNLEESSRRIADPEVAEFCQHLIHNLVGESRVIITSRYLPADLPLPLTAHEEPLGDFPEATFLKFLLRDAEVGRRYRAGDLPHDLLVQLHSLLGGTPGFLDKICKVLRTINAKELLDELRTVKLPSEAGRNVLQLARDQYCEQIFTTRLYSYLPPESQRALSLAAVYGVPVNLTGLEAVTGVPLDQLECFTRDWLAWALAHPEAEGGEGKLWRVYGLLRDWLLAPERLAPDACRAAHRAAGVFLSDLEGKGCHGDLRLTRVDCLLEARARYLVAEAHDQARAVTERVSGFLLCRGLYQNLARLNLELLDHEKHPIPMGWVGRASYRRGEYALARKWYRQCLQAAEALNLDDAAAVALHNLGSIDLAQGDYVAARKKLLSSLEIKQRIQNPPGEAATLHQLATIDLEQGNYEAAREKFQTSLKIERRICDRAGEAATLHQLATIDLRKGTYTAARKKFQESQEVRLQTGDQAGEAATWHGLATADLGRGEYEAAREKFQNSLRIRQQIGDRAGEAAVLHGLATTHLRRGNYREARDGFQKSLTIMKQIKNRSGEAATRYGLATIDLRQGKYGAARSEFQRSLGIRQEIGDRAGEAATWHGLATIDLGEGDCRAAREKLLESLRIWQQIRNRVGEAAAWHQLASIDLGRGDFAAARDKLLKSSKIQQQLGNRAGQAAAWHQLGSIDLGEGDYVAAREKLLKSLEIQRQLGNRAGQAAAWHQLGSIDLGEGDYMAAREKLLRSLEIKQQLENRAGEAAAFYQLGVLMARLGRSDKALPLVALCAITLTRPSVTAMPERMLRPCIPWPPNASAQTTRWRHCSTRRGVPTRVTGGDAW